MDAVRSVSTCLALPRKIVDGLVQYVRQVGTNAFHDYRRTLVGRAKEVIAFVKKFEASSREYLAPSLDTIKKKIAAVRGALEKHR